MENSHTAKNLDYLTVLSRGNLPVSRNLLKNADDNLIDALSECVLQIVNGTVQIEHETARRKLEKLKPTLLLLAKKNCTRGRKRRFFLTKGLRLLELLLPPVLSFFLAAL